MTSIGDNVGKVMNFCTFCFSILKKHEHPSNPKTLTKSSSLLKWIMVPKIYLLILPKLYLGEYWQMETTFKMVL